MKNLILNIIDEYIESGQMQQYLKNNADKLRKSQITNIIPDSLIAVEEKIEYELEKGLKFKGYIDRIDKDENGNKIYHYMFPKDNQNYGIIGLKKEFVGIMFCVSNENIWSRWMVGR